MAMGSRQAAANTACNHLSLVFAVFLGSGYAVSNVCVAPVWGSVSKLFTNLWNFAIADLGAAG